jgi:hypothetical protein
VIAQQIVCGPDPVRYVQEIKKYADAGFDHVYIHQIGPDQEGFITFFKQNVMPAFP